MCMRAFLLLVSRVAARVWLARIGADDCGLCSDGQRVILQDFGTWHCPCCLSNGHAQINGRAQIILAESSVLSAPLDPSTQRTDGRTEGM